MFFRSSLMICWLFFLLVTLVSAKTISNKNANSEKITTFNLLEIYNEAYEKNGDFLAQAAQFKSQAENVPIALGALLPNLGVSYNYQENYSNPAVFTADKYYRSYGPTLSFSQALFDWSGWKTYTAAQYNKKANALAYMQAIQQLLATSVKYYFSAISQAQQLNYSLLNQEWNKSLYDQSLECYQAKLISEADLSAANAQYQQAISQVANAISDYRSAMYTLQEFTGHYVNRIFLLKPDFNYGPPKPTSMSKWVDVGIKQNLQVVQNEFLLEAADENISLAWGKFIPTLALTASLSKTTSFQNDPVTGEPDSLQPLQGDVGLVASMNLINGGADYATVKQNEYSREQSYYTLEQSKLHAVSLIKQAYTKLGADIISIKAYEKVMSSSEFSVQSMRSKYDFGSVTIIDLLNEQRQFNKSQLEYASARYQYINDWINLKLQSGLLSQYDIEYINSWLSQDTTNEILN